MQSQVQKWILRAHFGKKLGLDRWRIRFEQGVILGMLRNQSRNLRVQWLQYLAAAESPPRLDVDATQVRAALMLE